MDTANFKVGDIIKVFFTTEAASKSRQTPFEGKVIALRGQKGNKTFTVRKLASAKVAVERIFPLSSPQIDTIKVIKQEKVRRAKLYYLRKK